MDKHTAQGLEARLLQRAKERGEEPQKMTTGSTEPLYVQDLEERARRLGTTIDEVYERDQQLLSQSHPTADCLRPDEVMQCVRDERDLTYRAWEHYNHCAYCHGLVAVARPDAARFRELVNQLATLENDRNGTTSPASTIVIRTNSVFAKLDRGVELAVKSGGVLGLLTACFLLVFYFSPDWVRTKAPIWAWTNYQLERHTQQSLQGGDTAQAEALASELIRRQPGNPGWYLFRSSARQREGKEELARKDFVEVNKLLRPTGSIVVPAEWGDRPYRGPATSLNLPEKTEETGLGKKGGE